MVELFRVGAMALAWDAGSEAVVIEAQTPTEDGEYAELPDDAEEGPDLLRIRIDAPTARAFVRASRGARGIRPAGVPVLRRSRSIQRATSARAATASSTRWAVPQPIRRPRIDWLPASDLGDGRPGRIGMTVLPGKRGPSVRYPGRVYRADLERDLEALGGAGIARLILLVEDEELTRWSDPQIVERAAGFGVEIRRHPMPDGSPPGSVAEWTTSCAPWPRRAPPQTWQWPAWAVSGAPGPWLPVRWWPPVGRPAPRSLGSGSCDTRWPSRPRPRSGLSNRTGASELPDRLESRRD